jgi:hypothetical protein
MFRLCILVLIGFPLVSLAQDHSELVKERSELVKQRTKESVERIETELKQAKARLQVIKRGQINGSIRGTNMGGGTITFQTKEIKNEAIADAQESINEMTERLEKTKKGEVFSYGCLEIPLKLGEFGQLQQKGGHIVQVLDDSALLLKTHYTNQKTLNTVDALVMVNGVSTKGMTDRSAAVLAQVFEVTDTTTYTTNDGGTNTVFVLTPFNTSEIEVFLKAQKNSAKLKK